MNVNNAKEKEYMQKELIKEKLLLVLVISLSSMYISEQRKGI
jgi:hypothetical protein